MDPGADLRITPIVNTFWHSPLGATRTRCKGPFLTKKKKYFYVYSFVSRSFALYKRLSHVHSRICSDDPCAMSESSDVTEFLARVRELGEKTDREDELRAKRLEQEILEGRKRRQALRAERNRSQSPQKKSFDNIEKDPEILQVLGTLNDLVGTPTATQKTLENHKSSPKAEIRAKPAPLKPSSDLSKRVISGTRKISGPRLGPKPILREKQSNFVAENDLLDSGSRDRDTPDTDSRGRNTPSKPLDNSPDKRQDSPRSVIDMTYSPSKSTPSKLSPASPHQTSKEIPAILTPQHDKSSPLPRTLSSITDSRVSRNSTRSPYGSALLNVASNSVSPSGSPNSPGSAGNGSVRLNRSPTRGGGAFIQSALLKREGTAGSTPFSASPKLNGLFDSPIMLANPVAKTSSPTTSPQSSQFERARDSACPPAHRAVATPPSRLGESASFESVTSPVGTSEEGSLPRSVASPSLATAEPSFGTGQNSIREEDGREKLVSKRDTPSKPDALSKPGPPRPPIAKKPFEVASPKHPLAPSHTKSPDSRHWNSSRQTTWLESALKKNGPATPESGLVRIRTGILRGSRSPSPTKFAPVLVSSPALGYSPSISRHRSTFSADLGRSPSDIVRERPISYLESREKPSVGDSSPPAPREHPSIKEKPASVDYLLDKEPVTLKSLDSDNLEKRKVTPPVHEKPVQLQISPAAFNLPTLRPVPPKPLAPKPTAEAIERLNSLRKTTTQRFTPRDEEKERIEQTRASLRRSQTLQYKAPDPVKETILGAKQSLRQSSPTLGPQNHLLENVAEVDEPKKNMDSTHQEPKNFTDKLTSVLLQGPRATSPASPAISLRKASTLDDSELIQSSVKLTHITRSRTKGPKRRLPGAVRTDSGATRVDPVRVSSRNITPSRSAPGPISIETRETVGQSGSDTVFVQKQQPLDTISVAKRDSDLKLLPPKPRKPSSSVRVASRTAVAS